MDLYCAEVYRSESNVEMLVMRHRWKLAVIFLDSIDFPLYRCCCICDVRINIAPMTSIYYFFSIFWAFWWSSDILFCCSLDQWIFLIDFAVIVHVICIMWLKWRWCQSLRTICCIHFPLFELYILCNKCSTAICWGLRTYFRYCLIFSPLISLSNRQVTKKIINWNVDNIVIEHVSPRPVSFYYLLSSLCPLDCTLIVAFQDGTKFKRSTHFCGKVVIGTVWLKSFVEIFAWRSTEVRSWPLVMPSILNRNKTGTMCNKASF